MLSTVLFSFQDIVLQYGWIAVAHAGTFPPPPPPPTAIPNPLIYSSVSDLLNHLLAVLIIVSGVVVAALVAYAGLLYTLSLGDPKRRKQALDTLKYALIGFIIISLAYLIVSIVSSFTASI